MSEKRGRVGEEGPAGSADALCHVDAAGAVRGMATVGTPFSVGPVFAMGTDLDATPRFALMVDGQTEVTFYDDAGSEVLRVTGAGTKNVRAIKVRP